MDARRRRLQRCPHLFMQNPHVGHAPPPVKSVKISNQRADILTRTIPSACPPCARCDDDGQLPCGDRAGSLNPPPWRGRWRGVDELRTSGPDLRCRGDAPALHSCAARRRPREDHQQVRPDQLTTGGEKSLSPTTAPPSVLRATTSFSLRSHYAAPQGAPSSLGLALRTR